MGENRARWDRALDALEALYKDVERRSLSLPALSLRPFVICLWNNIKFIACCVIDFFLFLPMNAIIFLRNLFPGRWRYRSFSGSYWKYAITWLWRGEAPFFPSVVIRPIVKFMVIVHVYSRFRCIEQRIYLDDTLTDMDRSHLNRRVAAALYHWRRPAMTQVVFTYGILIGGNLIAVYKFFSYCELTPSDLFVLIPLLTYLMSFIVPAFMFKRSLMLGASGRALYFPGAISGNQGYSDEEAILASVGIKQREWPLDIVLWFISLAISYLPILFVFFEVLGKPVPSDNGVAQAVFLRVVVNLSVLALYIILYIIWNLIALYRRRKTGRY